MRGKKIGVGKKGKRGGNKDGGKKGGEGSKKGGRVPTSGSVHYDHSMET